MASVDDELQDLKNKNNELVQKVQYWKVLAGQRENEKLNLMKEINDLRLKLSSLRSNGNVQAQNLDKAIQAAGEKAMGHLVMASNEIARTIELTKTYMKDKLKSETSAPRWSSLGGTPASVKKDKVHRVPPMMLGGQSIQPVVALTMLDISNARSATRSPNMNRSTERAVPMHMLQDVYIPLTRIDAELQAQNMDTEDANLADDSTSEHSHIDDNDGITIEESQRMSDDEGVSPRVLDAVAEDIEPENDSEILERIDNPLEGPSWMLDVATDRSRTNLEPDSTTELEGYCASPVLQRNTQDAQHNVGRREFSPTVRRRKRTSSPRTPRRASHYSPRPLSARRLSNSGRVLKVVVAKLRLDGDSPPECSPPKRPAVSTVLAFDAPSPNGATVPGLIVSETSQDELESLSSGEPLPHRRKQRTHHKPHTHAHTDTDMDVDERQSRTDRVHSRSRERDARYNNKDKLQRQRSDSENDDGRNTPFDKADVNEGRSKSSERKERHRTISGERNERQRAASIERNERNRTESRERKERQRSESGDRSRAESCERQRPISRNHTDARGNSVERNLEGHEESRAESRVSNNSRHQGPRAGSGRGASGDSDSSGGEREGRPRRPRKMIVYKEIPLNRKMRR